MLDPYREANRMSWDERAPLHVASPDYGRHIKGLISDPGYLSTCVAFERTELGDVEGKRLLHLQCHIGTDTLSWARLGATVTGTDFSSKSLEAARSISERSGIPARFVLAELYETPSVLPERFDVVYTGVGAICWLPDILKWAQVVSRMLEPGGTFYIHDGHPMMLAIADDWNLGELRLSYPYFDMPEPVAFEDDKTYVESAGRLQHRRTYEWSHSLGAIVTALIEAGLQIEFLHEHQRQAWRGWPHMVEDSTGWWRLPEHPERLPLMFSIRARKIG